MRNLYGYPDPGYCYRLSHRWLYTDLIALGFVLIYKATSVLNLAMGEFMTLGAFVCLTALTAD